MTVPILDEGIPNSLAGFRHPTRYKILASLYNCGEMTVDEITFEIIEGSESIRSHLADLVKRGILSKRKNSDGLHVYEIIDSLVIDVLETVEWYAMQGEGGIINEKQI